MAEAGDRHGQVRAAIDKAMAGALGDPTGTDALSRLADQVLAQQLDLALHWMRESVLQTHVPVQFADAESPVRLRVLKDAPRDPALAAEAGRFHTFEVSLELAALGRIDARVQWAGRDLVARFFVERDAVVPLFEAELAPLGRGLGSAGFSNVITEVRVDQARLALSRHATFEPPPGGSLIKVRG